MRRLLVRHRAFAAELALAVIVRVGVLLAYPHSALGFSDSWRYLQYATDPSPDPLRPIGYSLWLRLWFGIHPNVWLVVVIQHVIGIACGVVLYALLCRLGVRRWLGCLASGVFLLDGYQVAIEHFVLTETLFEALVIAVVVGLLWTSRPPIWWVAATGLLGGLVILVRPVGVVVVATTAAYLLISRRWAASALAIVTACLPVALYAVWFHTAHGAFALESFDGYEAYGQTAPIADCRRLRLPASERPLCPQTPAAQRPGGYFYVWDRASPLQRYEATHDVVGLYQSGNPSPTVDRLASDFAHRVIRQQPVLVLRATVSAFARYFDWSNQAGRRGWPITSWQFPTHDVFNTHGEQWLVDGTARTGPRVRSDGPVLGAAEVAIPARTITAVARATGTSSTVSVVYRLGQVHSTQARLLADYQAIVAVRGPLLALPLPLAAAVAWRARRRARSRWHVSRRLLAAGLLAITGAGFLAVPAFAAPFDFRYRVPAAPLLAAASALLAESLLRKPAELT